MFQPIRCGYLPLFDRSEKHKLRRGRWDLAFCQVSLNSIQQIQRRSRKCLSQWEARTAISFFDRPEKHKHGRRRWGLASVKIHLIPFSSFRGEVENVSANQRPGRLACFYSIGPKNANLVEDVEILRPVKFCWIPFSGFRGGVENIYEYQRPGRPSCFSDVPEKYKLGRAH